MPLRQKLFCHRVRDWPNLRLFKAWALPVGMSQRDSLVGKIVTFWFIESSDFSQGLLHKEMYVTPLNAQAVPTESFRNDRCIL
jgi:hypothetical protein